jgi:hypothetical protein
VKQREISSALKEREREREREEEGVMMSHHPVTGFF